jgi:hypothetical protein
MVFTENKEFNSLTPEDIYIVSKRDKILLNRVLNGNLSSMAFVKKDEEGNYKIKPATHRDNKIILQIFNSNK